MAELKTVTEPGVREGSSARSGIASPYFDLAASIAVADAVYKTWGGSCSPDQLTTSLGYKSTSSGTYLTRVSAAGKHFGLIQLNGDRISITERAKKIISPVMPEDAVGAKVEAFLAVPLFAKVYEEFKGNSLPPEVGMKNLFQTTYAILPDRVPQAVRVFFNSAEQAGFFSATNGQRIRLISPSKSLTLPTAKQADSQVREEIPVPTTVQHQSHKGGGSDGTGGVHSAIIGLLRDLPPPGTDWPKKQKERFVKAFQATLDFVYPDDDEDGGNQ